MNKSRVVRVFLESDMRCSHLGLSLIAKKQGVDVRILETNEHLIFINGAKNKIKFYSFNGVISYLVQRKGKIDLNIIEAVSRTFDDRGVINFDKALKDSLIKRLGVKDEGDGRGIVRLIKKDLRIMKSQRPTL